MGGISGLGRNLAKGGNSSQELYVQIILSKIMGAIQGTSTSTAGVAKDATLLLSNTKLDAILAAVQSGKDFELAIVKWTYTEEGVEHSEILKQITLREGSEFTVKYYNAAGVDVTEQVQSKGTVQLLDNSELLDEILNKIDELVGKTNKSVTSLSPTTSGSIPSGTISGSVCNIGSTDGTFNGQVIKAGMTISWGDPHVVSFTAMSYDATGTQFIINYVA